MSDLFSSQDRAQQHKAIRERIGKLASWMDYKIPGTDEALPVELAELHAKCGDVRDWVQQLVSTPLKPEQITPLREQLYFLLAQLEDLRQICDGLSAPLRRLADASSDVEERP